MRPVTLTMLFLLAACGPATEKHAEAAPADPVGAPDAPVAQWKGGQLTQAELDAEVHNQLVKLETEYLMGTYEAKSRALDALAVEKMLEAEAKSRDTDIDGLLKIEVEDKISAPTEAEMRELYPAMARRMGEVPFDTAKPYLEQELIYRKSVERYGAYIGELKAKTGFESFIDYPELPRMKVELADHDPIRGNAEAPVTIVQFAEYACHYCGVVEPTLDALLDKYGDKVRIVFKDYPLRETGPSIGAAVAAHCAGEQGKYWELNDKMLHNQRALGDAQYKAWGAEIGLDGDKFSACLASGKYEPLVKADSEQGQKLGVNSTPTFFINGLLVSGAQPIEEFSKVIDRELKN
ncbi:MAG: DsbA family protein [Deltaproteobacteria bacterium]|nr:MAG: DsbA family protein [Deltaproteobacteria bacterium]